MRRALVLTIGLILTVLPGVGSAARGDCRNRDLALELRLPDRKVHRGERVDMIMTVTNEGPRCTMVWSDGQLADFYVFDRDKKVYAWGHCKAFTQAIIEEEWPAGHKERYGLAWRQTLYGDPDCPGKEERARPGRYKARGHFMGAGEPRTEKVSFRIVR